MADRVLKNPKIRVMWDTIIDDVLGKDEVTGIRLKDSKSDECARSESQAYSWPLAIRPTQRSSRVSEMDENGYIVIHDGQRRTSPGVFARGRRTGPSLSPGHYGCRHGCMCRRQTLNAI